MREITWYFDFISPFAYLQHELFDRLPDDVRVIYKPILFAALLNRWEHKGPAEIPSKRVFTYRFVTWFARRQGIPLRMPPGHPFNPLPALRLAIASGNTPAAVGLIFRHIWAEGGDLNESAQLIELGTRLGLEDAAAAIAASNVKQTLRINGAEALEANLFGVPTFVAGGHLFWGCDATDMLLDFLANPALFEDPEMVRAATIPEAVRRVPS